MRLIKAYIDFEFDEYNDESQKEFDTLGSESDDPIGQFIKLAKARGETRDTDPVLMELLITLHRKIDDLTAFVKNETKELLFLKYNTEIESIGFDYFSINEELFENKRYYGRMNLPVFPKRQVPVIFEGIDKKRAKILHMHERDIKDYNAFITARERAIIREMKGNG